MSRVVNALATCCMLGLTGSPSTARQAQSAMRRLAIGRVLHAMRQLGLPPSQFDATHLMGLEAAAEDEAKEASATEEDDGVRRSRPVLPPLALEPQVALHPRWRELSSHAPAAVASRDDAAALVEALTTRSHGSFMAAAGLVRLMMALAQQREQDGRLCVCVLRLLRRVQPHASGGIELDAMVTLLQQLIEGVQWSAASEGVAASKAGGKTGMLDLEDTWRPDAEPLDHVLELEGLQLVVETLEADSAGILRSRIASSLQARPRRAASCLQAMVKRLQRGVAAARSLEDHGRPQVQQYQLEVEDPVVIASIASSPPDEAWPASTKFACGLLAELRGLELTLRVALLLHAGGAGPPAFVRSPSGTAADHLAEADMVPPLANLVSFPAQRELGAELAELCVLGLHTLAAMASGPCGRERRTFLGSSVLASCSWLQRQSYILGIDARTTWRLRDAATLVLARLHGLPPALLLADEGRQVNHEVLMHGRSGSVIASRARDVLDGGRQLLVLFANGSLLRNDEGVSWFCVLFVAWAFMAATWECSPTAKDKSWMAGMQACISHGPRQALPAPAREGLMRSIAFVVMGALGLVNPWFFVLMLLTSEMPRVARSLAIIRPRGMLMTTATVLGS